MPDLLCPTPIPGLTLIAAGRRVSNPTALLASTRMEHLLGEVKAHQPYSAIILDSSPVLLTSETKGLLPYIDTTILVVRAGKRREPSCYKPSKPWGKRTFWAVCSMEWWPLIFLPTITITPASITL